MSSIVKSNSSTSTSIVVSTVWNEFSGNFKCWSGLSDNIKYCLKRNI